MFGKRLITFLANAKILHGTTCGIVRSIHVPSSITTSVRYIDGKTNVDRYSTLFSKNVNSLVFCTAKRHKSVKKNKKSAKDDESDDEDDENVEELTGDKNAKVVTMNISSMRVDLIVKAGLGIARNKAESAFYDSKIRVNGQKVLKKSSLVKIGDSVDVVRGPSPKNPNFLLVSRITILTAVIVSDGYRIKFTKDKSLVIENYDDSWEPVTS